MEHREYQAQSTYLFDFVSRVFPHLFVLYIAAAAASAAVADIVVVVAAGEVDFVFDVAHGRRLE